MSRATNQELCDEFRKLLTEGARPMAKAVADGLYMADGLDLPGDRPQFVLDASQPWRNNLWKAFAEIERRLCPQPPER